MMNQALAAKICSQGVKVHLADGIVEEFLFGTNGNTLVVGPPGTGKTESMLKPDILDNKNASFVIDDKKGALSRALTPYLEENGYAVFTFDLINFKGNLTYNPIEMLSSREEIMTLAQFLIPKDRKTVDEFWLHTSRQLLVAAIEIGMQEYGKDMSFRQLCAMIDEIDTNVEDNPTPESLDAIQAEIERERRWTRRQATIHGYHIADDDELPDELAEWNEDDEAALFGRPSSKKKDENPDGILRLIKKHLSQHRFYRGMQDYLASRRSARDTFKSIVISLRTELAKYESEKLFKVMDHNSFDFKELGKRAVAIFVANSDTDAKFATVIQLFYRDVTKTLLNFADNECEATAGKLPRHVRFIFDDFCSGIRVPDFELTVANCRSRNISYLIAIQDLDQLRAVYGADNAGSISACMCYQAFYPTKNPTTAKFIADISGMGAQDVYGMGEGYVFVWTNGPAKCRRRFQTHDMPEYHESLRLMKENTKGRQSLVGAVG